MLRTRNVRVLGSSDAPAAWQVIDRDPIGNVFVAARARVAGLDRSRLGGELWGYGDGENLESLCYYGANLVPVTATPAAARAFADRAAATPRFCSSIVGREEAVAVMWDRLRRSWSAPRDVRPGQPLLATRAEPRILGDPAVRRVRPAELDILLPAAVAMYTEEVGISPIGRDRGAAYRARVQDLIRQGHAFARIEDGEVLFKAELGAVSGQACQVQGVWVTPRLRGRGFGTAGMATVVREALRTVAPVVSLYVNAHNTAARRAYERVGFSSAGTYMSVLF